MPHDLAVLPAVAGVIDPASADDNVTLIRKLGAALDGARELARTELSLNTIRGYERDMALFQAWCRERDVSALPASPATVGAYLWSLYEHGRQKGGKFSAGTLARRAAAIAFDHRRADLEDPTRGKVRGVLRSARAKIGVAPRFRRQALTVEMVDAMLMYLSAGLPS